MVVEGLIFPKERYDTWLLSCANCTCMQWEEVEGSLVSGWEISEGGWLCKKGVFWGFVKFSDGALMYVVFPLRG